MELPCLPAETPTTTASSTSTDPLYDNYCPPFAPHRGGRERDGAPGRQGLAVVTGLPCNPVVAGRAPTGPEVPTLGAGGRGPGIWPDHSYCSWGGGAAGGLGTQGWDAAELRTNRTRGGEGGGGGGGGGGRRRIDGGRGRERSPSPPQSQEHESALSVYDNLHDAAVTPDDLMPEPEGIAMETGFQDDAAGQVPQMMTTDGDGVSGESSTWSSCEIILGESSDADRMQETAPEQKPEPDTMEAPRLPHHHLSVAASPPHPGQGGLQGAQGPLPSAPQPEEPPQQPPAPRVPPPVPLADPNASALRSLLTGLTQQIGRQREDYETRIYGLEQRNEELLMEVVGLRANLAQQKRWYQVVQAKIAESEELRATAEQHNAALQRELEQFFDTFGELNNEAKKTECIVSSF